MTDQFHISRTLSRAILLTCLAALPCALPARAVESVERIVAVVNDEAISEGDLAGRLKLAMLAGNYPDNAEVREKLTPQVLHSLIDDQLRIQEAKRLKLHIEQDEVTDNIKQIAEQNNQTEDQFAQSLAKQGVPVSTLQRQAMAQLAWAKVVQKAIRPRIDMSQEEIEAAYVKMAASVQKPQYLLAEIFLPVDSPTDDVRVKAIAGDLENQLHSGANFAKLAQQFSQAAGADKGGDMGWTQEGELPDELDQAMRALSPPDISAPIRTQGGYHILFVREKGSVLAGDPNEATVHLKNVLIPYASQPTAETMPRFLADAEKMRASLPNCAAMDEKGKRDGLAGDFGKPGDMAKVGALPKQLAAMIGPLKVDQMSQPMPTQEGIMMFMVCARRDPPPREPPTKDQVANQIYLERLDLQQQRYLSDLRSAALIDIRG